MKEKLSSLHVSLKVNVKNMEKESLTSTSIDHKNSQPFTQRQTIFRKSGSQLNQDLVPKDLTPINSDNESTD